MLPKAKWLPNLLGLSLKKEKEAHPNEQQEGEEENTLTDDSTGSDAPTFIINDDLPVEANDGVTPETKKRNWSIQCNCCEQELRPGINCIPTSPKNYICSSCGEYVCKNCKGQCHECLIKNNLILSPEVLMTVDNASLVDYLQMLHYPKAAFDNWTKEYLVKQLLTRFNLHSDWVPKPLSEKPSRRKDNPPPEKEKRGNGTEQSTDVVTKRETKSQERKPPKSTSVFYMTPAGASTPLVEERARPVHKRTPRQEDVSNSGAKNAERAIKSKSLEINAASKELDHSGAYKDFKLVVSTSELQMPPPKNQITKKDHTDSKHPSSHRQGTPSMGKMQARSLNALDNQSPGTHRKSSTRQPKGYSQDTNHNQLKPKGEPVNVSGSASTTTAESWKYSSADPIVMSSQDSHKRTGPRGSLENVISAIRKPLTPQLEKKRKEQDHGGKDEIPNFAEKFDSLKDITCLNDIDDLRTKQMKAILKKHGVDVRTLSTDQELRYAVIRLWSYKKEKGNGSTTITAPEVNHNGQKSLNVGPQSSHQQPLNDKQPILEIKREPSRKHSTAPKASYTGPKLEDIPSIRAIESMDVSQLRYLLHYHNFNVKNFDKKHQLVYAVICLWNAFHATDDFKRDGIDKKSTVDTINDTRKVRWDKDVSKDLQHHVAVNSQLQAKNISLRETPKRTNINESSTKSRTHSSTRDYDKTQYLESWLQHHSNETPLDYGKQQTTISTSTQFTTKATVHYERKHHEDTRLEQKQPTHSVSPSIISFGPGIAPRAIQEEFTYIDDSFSDISAPLAPRIPISPAPLASKRHL